MPRKCPVPLCKSIRGSPKFKHLSFHKFPKDPLRLREWLLKCQILDLSNPDLYTVCSLHFVKSDYALTMPSVGKKLKPHAVPSRKLPPDLYYMKNQDAEPLVIDVDPMPLVEYCEDDDVNYLNTPAVFQPMMLNDELISSARDVPTEYQCIMKDGVINSPLDDPRVYQCKMLEDEMVNSVLVDPRINQHGMLKDEVVSSYDIGLSPSKSFVEPIKLKKNMVIKICKFVKPLRIAKKSPEDDIPLNDLKTELLKPGIRFPLAVMNDLVSVIHYDHSYALPFSEDLIHKTSESANYPVNENGQFDQSLFSNDVGTMTESLGKDYNHLYEFEKEIRWLWQRNQKLNQRVSLLSTRNRQLVFHSLRTQKELLRKSEKYKKLKKQVIELKGKHPELNILVE